MPCAPRMSGCKQTCLHRQLVQEYTAARIAAELAREEATRGFPTEMREHPPIVTFHDWLKQTARRDTERTEPTQEAAA